MATAWHWSSQIHLDRMLGIHSSKTNVISSSASEKMEQVSLSLSVCVCVYIYIYIYVCVCVLLFFSLTSVLALCGQVVFMMKRTWTSFWIWFTKVGIRITSTCLCAMVALKSKKTSRCTSYSQFPLFSVLSFLFLALTSSRESTWRTSKSSFQGALSSQSFSWWQRAFSLRVSGLFH